MLETLGGIAAILMLAVVLHSVDEAIEALFLLWRDGS
jgi:hypothetical protein